MYHSDGTEASFLTVRTLINSQRVSFETIELPKTPRLTPDQISQIDQQRGAGDLDEKETVFKPNNE